MVGFPLSIFSALNRKARVLGLTVELAAMTWPKNVFLRSLMLLFLMASLTGAEPTPATLIVKNAWVLPMSGQQDIPEGVVVIDQDKIVALGTEELLAQYRAETVIDAEGGLLLPGMVNTHSHLPMVAFRGLGEEGIKNRLFAYFFPLEKRMLSRELIYAATRLGALEMIQGGVTTYADMYYHMDEMAAASKEIGIRAVLGETVIKFPVVDAPVPYGGLEYAENFVKKFQNDPLITPALAPHAVFTVSIEKLKEVQAAAERWDVPVLIHASEFSDEAERIESNPKNLSPILWLQSHGLLTSRLLLAHAIHLSDKDIAAVLKSGAGVAHNPMANAKGATGIAPAWELKKRGARMGLGTDGPMSSNQTDLFRTLSYACSMQRLKHRDRTIMVPKDVVEMATLGGARALHMEKEIGSLEVGKKADLIIVETKSVNMRPLYDPYAALVFQANPSNVATTVVNGTILMHKRQMLSTNAEEIVRALQPFESEIADFAKDLAKKAKASESPTREDG